MQTSIKKVHGLVFSFILSVLSTGGFIGFIVATWTDQRYIDSLNLPPQADSIGIPLFGGIFLFLMAGATSIFFHLVLLAIMLSLQKIKTVNILGLVQPSHSKAARVIQAIAIILLLFAVLFFIRIFENVNAVANTLYCFSVLTLLISSFVNTSAIVSMINQRKR